MGTNIHMSIVTQDGNFRHRNIFNGRNSEWFDNLQNRGCSSIYDEFPNIGGLPDIIPEEIKNAYDAPKEDYCYYGFYHIVVEDFCKWFDKVRPDIDAGWLSTYEKWLYDTKGIIPKNIPHYLDSKCNPHDYHFVEITNPYDCSNWLNQFIKDNVDVCPEDYIVYYFDC